MVYITVGDRLTEIKPDTTISETDYVVLEPLLRGRGEVNTVAHLRRRQDVLSQKIPESDLLLAYFIGLGYIMLEGTEKKELRFQFPSHFYGEKNHLALSTVLQRYLGYLERDGLAIRSVNGTPLHTASNSSLEEKLTAIFGERASVVSAVCQAVSSEIMQLQEITTSSMAGLHGGVVGKYRSVDETSVVFKVETDFRAAYKSTRAPFVIHQAAIHNQLAARLAPRIPQPLTAFPLQQGEYWISLAEDFSQRIIPTNKEDLLVMGSELKRGLDYTIVEALYLSALYQEVMENIFERQPDTLLSMGSSVPSNLSEEEMRSRLHSRQDIFTQITSVVEPVLAGTHYRNEYLDEIAFQDTQFVHGDFKSVHRHNGVLLDTGSTRQDTVAIDLARVFMNQPKVFSSSPLYISYVDSFVRMRQRLNSNYSPPHLLATTTTLQTMNDALRNLGWEIQQGETHNISVYLSVLEKLQELNPF